MATLPDKLIFKFVSSLHLYLSHNAYVGAHSDSTQGRKEAFPLLVK